MTKVADQSHHGAAEKISDAAQQANPNKTTAERQRYEPELRHAGNSIEGTCGPTHPVDVLGNEDRERAETVRHALQTRLRVAIEAEVADWSAEDASGRVGEVVAGHPGKGPPYHNFGKAITLDESVIKKSCMGQHAGQQEGQVSFKHHQHEDPIHPVHFDQM